MLPDTITGGDNGSGYNYRHNTIEGFSLNHLSGIGWYGDLGNIQIMPVVGTTDLRSGSNLEVPFLKGNKGWKSDFTHEKESAKAGYYSVMLDTYGILAEATSTVHTGVLRFTYPQNSASKVIFNFSCRIGGKADFQTIDIINDHRIEGGYIALLQVVDLAEVTAEFFMMCISFVNHRNLSAVHDFLPQAENWNLCFQQSRATALTKITGR